MNFHKNSELKVCVMLQMALKNSQFTVALRLLSTVPRGSAEVTGVKAEGRNLLHVLALHAQQGADVHGQQKVSVTVVAVTLFFFAVDFSFSKGNWRSIACNYL